MIFVTVGTHEQQFNRLIQCVDELKRDNVINEDVIIQTGFSTYEPKYCAYQKLYPYSDMNHYINEARIVITHGGPSSFIPVLQCKKIPIVVPRRSEFNEHVNNHQLYFCRKVKESMGNIIVIEDVGTMAETITEYDKKVAEMNAGLVTNNIRFNAELENIVNSLLDK